MRGRVYYILRAFVVQSPPMTQPPLIDEELAAFLRGPLGIGVASRAAGNVPVLVRCSGCRVSADRRSVKLYLARSRAGPVIDAVRATRVAAAVFSLPSSHRTVQLKGIDARIGAAEEGDYEAVEHHIEAFARELAPLGYNADMARAMLWLERADLATLSFTPSAAFMQTPGPGAGEPLRAPT
jgi:hypothetical protein